MENEKNLLFNKEIKEDVAVIILNYNTWERTLEEVDHLSKILEDSYDLIIVDNCSNNDSYAMLNEKNAGRYVLLSASCNGGYAAGNNIGIKYALEHKYKYSLIINNDIEILDSHFISKMVNVFQYDKKIAAVSPDIYSPDGYLFNRDCVKPSFFDMTIGAYFYKKKGRNIILNNCEWGYVYRPQGCCMIVDNEKMMEVNYMDENTFLYCEEPILAERLLLKGYKCSCLTAIKVIHNHSYTTKQVLNKIYFIKCNLKSFNYLLMKYRKYDVIKRVICSIFQFVRLILQR